MAFVEKEYICCGSPNIKGLLAIDQCYINFCRECKKN